MVRQMLRWNHRSSCLANENSWAFTVDVDSGFAPSVTANLRNFTILRKLPAIDFPFDFEDVLKKTRQRNIVREPTERALLALLLGS
jgi:hypothetical protein